MVTFFVWPKSMLNFLVYLNVGSCTSRPVDISILGSEVAGGEWVAKLDFPPLTTHSAGRGVSPEGCGSPCGERVLYADVIGDAINSATRLQGAEG